MSENMNCRACKSSKMHLFLRMGTQPAANAFITGPDIEEASYPLDALACLECGLIQVENKLPPDFFKHYLYVPSCSPTMERHFRELAKEISVSPRLGPIVDIGCNDGLFLKACKELFLPAIGVDPAQNLAEISRGHGEVLSDHFTLKVAQMLRKEFGQSSVIISTNTISHVDDLQDFTAGLKELLAPEGMIILEIPYSGELLEKNEFDTIYHEHLSQFSVLSLVKLLANHQLEILKIKRLEVHGGSLRVTARHAQGYTTADIWVRQEEKDGFLKQKTYDDFAIRVMRNRGALKEILVNLKAQKKTVVGYGAPAKGNCLLNYCRIGPDTLDYLADKSTLKQGLYSPGMHIPIVAPSRILEDQPDYVLILAWNFSAEIMAEQAEYQARGGKFILPVPQPQVV